LEKLPLELFVDKSNNGQDEYGWAPFEFFKERIDVFLVNQLRRSSAGGCTSALVGFLNNIVDNLLVEAPSDTCLKGLREQYIHDIVRAVVAMELPTVQHMLIPPISTNYTPRTTVKYIEQQIASAADMLSAAAAVGNIEAVRSLYTPGDKTLGSDKNLLGQPIGAAAATGQLEVLKYFSQTIKTGSSELIYSYELHVIIKRVIDVGESDTAACLIDIMSELYPLTTSSLRGKWLELAIGAGCIITLKAIMATKALNNAKDAYLKSNVKVGYCEACRKGFTDMIRHLFQSHRTRQLLPTRGSTGCLWSLSFEAGLLDALKEGRRGVSETLIAMDPKTSPKKAFKATMAARHGSKFIMTKLLLAHRFTVDMDILQDITDFNTRVVGNGEPWKLGRPTSDEVKTAILLAWEVKKHLPIEALPKVSQLGRVCAKVTEDGFTGPLEPIFYAVADEVHAWIKHFLHGEQIAREFERLKLDY
jgi:hypothetical protein